MSVVLTSSLCQPAKAGVERQGEAQAAVETHAAIQVLPCLLQHDKDRQIPLAQLHQATAHPSPVGLLPQRFQVQPSGTSH